MATTAADTMANNAFLFDDIFSELEDDLAVDAADCDLNHFYIDFTTDEIQDDEQANRPSTSQHPSRSHQCSQATTSAEKNRAKREEGEGRFFHDVPDYLLPSNSDFRVKFFPEIYSFSNPMNFDDLQQLAMLTHQMSIIHLHQQLWQCSLQSGLGQFKHRKQLASSSFTSCSEDHPAGALSFWPKFVTSAMISRGILHANREEQIDQNTYINFVQNYLRQLETKNNQYRCQFEAIKKRLPAHIKPLDDRINDFIRNEGLIAMQLHFQIRLTLIEYIGVDRSYQWEYFLQKPTDSQIKLAKHICSLTFNTEHAEQELTLFQVWFPYHRLPKALDLLDVFPPRSITTITASDVRERLLKEYKSILREARSDLLLVFTQAAQVKRDHCRNTYGREIADLWKDQRTLPVHERLTSPMLKIIEKREKNLVECLKHIYDLKGRFYQRAPLRKHVE